MSSASDTSMQKGDRDLGTPSCACTPATSFLSLSAVTLDQMSFFARKATAGWGKLQVVLALVKLLRKMTVMLDTFFAARRRQSSAVAVRVYSVDQNFVQESCNRIGQSQSSTANEDSSAGKRPATV